MSLKKIINKRGPRMDPWGTPEVTGVGVCMEILAMFEFPSLFNGAAYRNKRRAIDILNIVLLVHFGCIAVACRVPEKQAVENLLSFQ